LKNENTATQDELRKEKAKNHDLEEQKMLVEVKLAKTTRML
jgi:hypothetical protein